MKSLSFRIGKVKVEMKCSYHYQAGGKCNREATRLVENKPFCSTHAPIIAWRLLQQGKKT